MRVLHVVPSLAATRGGPTQVVLRLTRALAERGVETGIVATRADLDGPGEAAARAACGPQVEVTLVAMVGPKRLELSPALVPALLGRLGRADVVHVHTVFTFPVAVAPILCRALGRAHVVRPAGTLDRSCIALRSTRQKRLAIAAYVRGNLAHADAVHATSDAEAAELAEVEPRARVEVLELGAEAEPSLDPGRRGERIGFLGRLHPSKQLELLLDGFALIPGAPLLELAGAGEPAYAAGLRARAERLGVAERVRWLGHVDGAAKAAFLARCDLVALPSLHESFGVAAAEAMAAGRAVVVTPGVALAEVVRAHGAGLVAEAAPEPLARALSALLDDGAARARMAFAARSLAEARWTWGRVAERTIALYQRTLDARAAAV